MVHSPLYGERVHGRNAPSEEGSIIPTLIPDMENEKGKGLVRASHSLIDGEGSSGLKKEEMMK